MLWLKVGALSPQTQLEFIRKVSLAISSSVTFANIGMLWLDIFSGFNLKNVETQTRTVATGFTVPVNPRHECQLIRHVM